MKQILVVVFLASIGWNLKAQPNTNVITITNLVKAPDSYRTIRPYARPGRARPAGTEVIYDVNTSKEWETVDLSGVNFRVAYKGVPGAPISLSGVNKQLQIQNYPYNPKDFIRVNRNAQFGETVTPIRNLKCRAFPHATTNYTALGEMIRTVSSYDYGLPVATPIEQVITIDAFPTKGKDQYLLGVRYLGGTGVVKDLKKAEHWFSSAMTNGSMEASNAFKKFFPKPIDNK